MSAPQKTTDAPAKIKAHSLRDQLGKTVRLLTKSGIDVAFRGHQPMVLSKGNKAVRLVLPEINDDAPASLLDAIHGYLDHEVGHIFYTPFARCTRGDKKTRSLLNIVEDIRLEKLLPRDLPGTKENLERMYEKFIPTMIDPAVKAALAKGDPGRAFSGVLVPGLRGLAGQKAFQDYMDINDYWQHLRALIVKMPTLAARLKALETFADVESLVEDMIVAMKPKQPEPKDDEVEDHACHQEADDDDDDQSDPADADDDPDGESDEDAAEDDKGETDDEADGGKGHGDGSGNDDEEGDATDDEGNCGGDDDSDDDGDGEAGGGDDEAENDADQGERESKRKDQGDKGEPDETDEAQKKGGKDGNENLSLTDALKQLDPKQRRALFMYKNRNAKVDAIAKDLSVTEQEAAELLRDGRRRLRELMKGAKN